MKKYSRALHIFRRDLRLDDNTALLKALEESEAVIPCFIFDPRQLEPENGYFSRPAFRFMLESLADLEKQLEKQHGRLYLFHGIPEKIIPDLYKTLKFDALFINSDYTPFSKKRDDALAKVASKLGIDFISYHDLLLNNPDAIKKSDDKPYTIFTPYYKKASPASVIPPLHNRHRNYHIDQNLGTLSLDKFTKKLDAEGAQRGGRSSALEILKNINQFKNYKHTHDIPSTKTTELSAHNKFGTISIRELYACITEQLGKDHPLIRQLYWRDFFTQLAYHFPHVFGHSFHEKYNKITWQDNPNHFKHWCDGTTGFPIVDAGMRQLKTTGFMHNRVRMIVGSFLVKDLHINWLAGEKYFAQHLIDYDPAVNNGNWQWIASTGADAQPYFRIFNPWLQQKKFDPACIYIKTWLPELKDIPPATIHAWYNPKKRVGVATTYPAPIADHATEATRAKLAYKKAAHSAKKLT
jgi:deoxyribodipyrimidine photo-lyase